MLKTFDQQHYPCTIRVKVNYTAWADSGNTFTDEIKGLNPGHALHLAYLNWPHANRIQLLKEIN